jgi:hypothetical protein
MLTLSIGYLLLNFAQINRALRRWGNQQAHLLSLHRVLDGRLREEIRSRLRKEYTPRHVTDAIVQVPDIPVTLTGKKMEVPVRRILLGALPEAAANRDAMANPASLEAYVSFAKQWPTVEE